MVEGEKMKYRKPKAKRKARNKVIGLVRRNDRDNAIPNSSHPASDWTIPAGAVLWMPLSFVRSFL